MLGSVVTPPFAGAASPPQSTPAKKIIELIKEMSSIPILTVSTL